MNVSLTPQLEEFVHGKVASGRYHTASEVIREALRLLEDRDLEYDRKLEALRKEIAIGIEQADRGEVRSGDEFFKELRARGRKTLEERKQARR